MRYDIALLRHLGAPCTLVTVCALTLAPAAVAAQSICPGGRTDKLIEILDVGTREARTSAGSLEKDNCYGDGDGLRVADQIKARFSTGGAAGYTVSGPARMAIKPGVYEIRGGEYEVTSGSSSATGCQLHRAFVVSRDGKKVKAQPCGTTFRIVADSAAFQIQVTEGAVRLSEAVRLRAPETARVQGGNTRREEAEPVYFEQTVNLTPESNLHEYSLTEDEYIELGDMSCQEFFTTQLEMDMQTGVPAFYIGEGYRNIGDCYLVDGNWPEAINCFNRALANDIESFGQLDPTVATDYRALGEAYLESGVQAEAEANFLNALQIDLRLSQQDPDDLEALAAVAEDHRFLGDTYLDFAWILYEEEVDYELYKTLLDAAVDRFRQGLAISDRLSDLDAYYFGEDWALDLELLADALEIRGAPGDVEEAERNRSAARRMMELLMAN